MSGTSHDGVDAALVRMTGAGPAAAAELLHHSHYPYPARLREKIASAFMGNTAHICALNFELGEVFARAALKCAEEAGVAPYAIASHGQTIYHIPPGKGQPGSTLQIGEPAVIARRTGRLVVAQFRPADMAAGGQGAPLVPYADWVLFKGSRVKCSQNIGGMANVTVITPKIDGVTAFDTGPGNALMDDAVKLLFGKKMDRGGRIAARGRVDEKLLGELMRHPFLKKKPPRSTGRETFGSAYLKEVLGRYKKTAPADMVRTLTEFTARSIAGAYEEFIFPKYDVAEVILSGGGARNSFLVSLLKDYLAPVKVSLIEKYGIPAEAKEAMSFAILANETLNGNPSNVPGATGARRKVVLGAFYLP